MFINTCTMNIIINITTIMTITIIRDFSGLGRPCRSGCYISNMNDSYISEFIDIIIMNDN